MHLRVKLKRHEVSRNAPLGAPLWSKTHTSQLQCRFMVDVRRGFFHFCSRAAFRASKLNRPLFDKLAGGVDGRSGHGVEAAGESCTRARAHARLAASGSGRVQVITRIFCTGKGPKTFQVPCNASHHYCIVHN